MSARTPHSTHFRQLSLHVLECKEATALQAYLMLQKQVVNIPRPFDAVLSCNQLMQMLQPQLVRCMQIERLPVFFKQRDNYFFPAWTFVIPTTIMRLPVSFVESLVWTVITYFEIDLAPTAGRYWYWS